MPKRSQTVVFSVQRTRLKGSCSERVNRAAMALSIGALSNKAKEHFVQEHFEISEPVAVKATGPRPDTKQHGQKTWSGESMEKILKSRYRISKLTRVFKRPFASFQWSFWPQEYTLNAWKGLDLFLQKIFLYFLYILFSFSKIVTYYASHKM